MLPSYSVNVSGGIVSTHPQSFIVVGDKDIHPANIVFNSGTTPILNGVHDAVDHDLGSKGIVAGHGNHANSDSFAAGRNALGIGATTFGAGAVMGYIDLQRVKGLTVCGAANLLLKVHVFGSPKCQAAFIAGGIQMDTDTAFRMDPFPTSVFTVSGKDENMVPAGTTVIHQEAKVTGQQLGLIDGVGVVPLTVGTSMQAHANRSLIGPVRKAGTVKTKGPNRTCGTGTCRSHQLGCIPLIVPGFSQ